jgi:hypothetical protein
MASRELVIDACCTINLLATHREVELVQALGVRLLDTPLTSGEPCMAWTLPDAEGRRGREPISTKALRAMGLLVTRALDTKDLIDAFVRAGERLAPPDASGAALASTLGLPLATDDRKVRHVAREIFPGIELLSTLDLFNEATRVLAWSEDQLATLAVAMRWRGNFRPPRQDPHMAWYAALLRRAGVDV